MIYLYISPSCQSCRKTIKWFDDEQIPYTKINILKDKLSKEDVFRMLKNSLSGFDDIISKRSKPFIENNLEIDEMKTSELINFIIENPTVLKRPIIVANNLLEVGYNSDDIRAFIPPEKRVFKRASCDGCTEKDPNTCDYHNSSILLIDEIKKEFEKGRA
ncbi:transcriptional regulator Spx [bacterium]|nr:transcriptional regulator Spx [bacterium]